MNRTAFYLLTFLAVFMPFVAYVLFANNTPASRGNRKQEEEELPSLFRFCLTSARIMNVFGVGSLIHRLFPAPCRIMRKKLQYAGLNVSPEFIYQSRVFLVILLGALGAAGAWMVVGPDQQGAVPVAGLIGAFIGWFLPGVTVGNLVQTRQTKILQAIPFSIDLISSAMRGGG